jgi:hypothetical protein
MSLELIKKIKMAFASVEYPGDQDITDSTYGEEAEALKREFIGEKDWRVLDSEFLDQAPEGWRTALAFFSDRAFHFYLPAYLIADIQGELTEVCPEFHLFYSSAVYRQGNEYLIVRLDQFNSEKIVTYGINDDD